jgi:hypothetical protein
VDIDYDGGGSLGRNACLDSACPLQLTHVTSLPPPDLDLVMTTTSTYFTMINLWTNVGTSSSPDFTQANSNTDMGIGGAYATAWSDLSNDGMYDLVSTWNDGVTLYLNRGTTGAYLFNTVDYTMTLTGETELVPTIADWWVG